MVEMIPFKGNEFKIMALLEEQRDSTPQKEWILIQLEGGKMPPIDAAHQFFDQGIEYLKQCAGRMDKVVDCLQDIVTCEHRSYAVGLASFMIAAREVPNVWVERKETLVRIQDVLNWSRRWELDEGVDCGIHRGWIDRAAGSRVKNREEFICLTKKGANLISRLVKEGITSASMGPSGAGPTG